MADGDRAPTISDVAALAGVSRAAVSKVLRDAYGVSDSMRDRVGAAIDLLEYRPSRAARALRGGSRVIGLEIAAVGSAFVAALVQGMLSVFEPAGYRLVIAPVGLRVDEGSQPILSLADFQVDGVVAVSPILDRRGLERLAPRLPLVVLGRRDRTQLYDSVSTDDVVGTRLLIEHLFDEGHRRIAHITLRDDSAIPDSESPRSVRLAEYQRLMTESGALELIQVARIQDDLDEDEIHAVTGRLLESAAAPTAIVVGDDALTAPVLRACADHERSDIPIFGYDDVGAPAEASIGLRSIDRSGAFAGETSARLLLERIGGRTNAVHHVIEPELSVRRSTRPKAS